MRLLVKRFLFVKRLMSNHGLFLSAQSVSGSIAAPFAGGFSGGRHSLSGTVGLSPQSHAALPSVRPEALPPGHEGYSLVTIAFPDSYRRKPR